MNKKKHIVTLLLVAHTGLLQSQTARVDEPKNEPSRTVSSDPYKVQQIKKTSKKTENGVEVTVEETIVPKGDDCSGTELYKLPAKCIVGIAGIGVTVLSGHGDHSYIGKAYVDPLGFVRVEKREQYQTRTFLSSTAYLRPFVLYHYSKSSSEDSKRDKYQDMSAVARSVYAGLTVGVGVNDSGKPLSGLPILVGGSIGLTVDEDKFLAVTCGGYIDPNTQRLEYPFIESFPYPYPIVNSGTAANAAPVANLLVPVPTTRTRGWYSGCGFSFNYKF